MNFSVGIQRSPSFIAANSTDAADKAAGNVDKSSVESKSGHFPEGARVSSGDGAMNKRAQEGCERNKGFLATIVDKIKNFFVGLFGTSKPAVTEAVVQPPDAREQQVQAQAAPAPTSPPASASPTEASAAPTAPAEPPKAVATAPESTAAPAQASAPAAQPAPDSAHQLSIPANLSNDAAFLAAFKELVRMHSEPASTPTAASIPMAPPMGAPDAPPMAPPMGAPDAPPMAPPMGAPDAPPLTQPNSSLGWREQLIQNNAKKSGKPAAPAPSNPSMADVLAQIKNKGTSGLKPVDRSASSATDPNTRSHSGPIDLGGIASQAASKAKDRPAGPYVDPFANKPIRQVNSGSPTWANNQITLRRGGITEGKKRPVNTSENPANNANPATKGPELRRTFIAPKLDQEPISGKQEDKDDWSTS